VGCGIGWSGLVDPLPEKDAAVLAARLEAMRLVQVPLTGEEVHRYYESYSNGVLWPLFHYFASELPLEIGGFDDYERVNRRFADAVVEHHRPGDLIWIQDYHLMRVPALVRARVPDARIGFFLHIPFPSSETSGSFPREEQILEGLLGADLVGFHTAAYVRHFSSSVLRTTGAWTDVDRIPGAGARCGWASSRWAWTRATGESSRGTPPWWRRWKRTVRLGAVPGRHRPARLHQGHLAPAPRLRAAAAQTSGSLRARAHGAGRGSLANRGERLSGAARDVDALVGRINGRFATSTWSPVRYLARGLSPPEVTALYRAADVLVVTPSGTG
jgi:trehalose 6-phosphate synthase/phosphatase